jgi:ferric-dicitrate binding protein FerR (iron transport regulator)
MTDQQSNEQHLFELARKWQEGTITPQERLEFDQWFNSFDDAEMTMPGGETPEELRERLYASIRTKEKIRQRTGGRVLLTRWTVAASILLLIGSAVWWQVLRPARSPLVATVDPRRPDTVIVPGSNKAILTLANGEQVILDSAKNGLLARQGATEVVKKGDGALSYAGVANAHERGAATEAVVLYNTITTPRGGQYTVTLPDGSKVWLNAASSIRFPTAFTGTSRNVEVRGEAYFEVAHDKARPFRVAVNKKMDVEVLGTVFNIMAYEEEGTIKTTLINGSVRVVKNKDEKILHPGQQAQLRPDGLLYTLNNADIQTTIAWKNGRTVFAGEDIQTIMRQVSRWYDVDVEYAGPISSRKFTGGIARDSDISVVLKILELNQVHFAVEGKKIVLMP